MPSAGEGVGDGETVGDGEGVAVGVGVGVPPATSSLKIVPVPSDITSKAPDPPVKRTVKVSFGSNVVSPLTTTFICCSVGVFEANVNVPDVAT